MTKRDNTHPQAEHSVDTLSAQRERAARLRDAAGRAAVAPPAPPTERERAGAEWRVLAGEGIHHGDGTVSYCSADGAVVRRPVADWVAYVAAQMHHRVQEENARRLNDPDLSDDARTALAARLRRDLRSDAVFELAFRPGDALSRALAGEEADAPPPRHHEAGAISRELRTAIEAHRSAQQLLIRDPVRDGARLTAAEARLGDLAAAVRAAPVRTLADLRWKMIYLWPGNLEEAGVPDGLADTLGAFREDVLRLAGEEAGTDAGESMKLPAAPDLVGLIDFGSASLRELLYLRELADLVGSTAYALASSGRGEHPRVRMEFNAAGQFMQRLGDALTDVESAAEQEARRRKPTNHDERETRLAVFADAVIRNDDPDELTAFAAELAAHAAAMREGR